MISVESPEAYDSALAILRRAFGDSAEFREGQWEAVSAVLEPGRRELVVQRTGWGKSLVYFLATRLLRDAGSGPTLLVSPLLSLMRNQTDLASKFGINAVSINSTNRDEWKSISTDLEEDRIDLLLVSPERLGNPDFVAQLLPGLEQRTRLLVIDEAHCISDWGHDFRPDYRRILRTVARLNADASILATTATANDRVIADIREQLGEQLLVQRGSLMRKSLRLRVQILQDQAERLAWLAQFVPKLSGSGIVYTLTVHDAKRVAEYLAGRGVDARAYYAELPTEERIEMETRFQQNDLKVLCATTALGMGYDKSDVAFVVHFQRPGSVISYYQQIGRAGRSLDRAEVVLLEGSEDDEITEYFIDSAFPEAEVFEKLRELMHDAVFPTLDAITGKTNFRRSKVEKALKLLEVEGAIDRKDDGFHWLNPDWRYEDLRSVEITKLRRRELEQMRVYARLDRCRMEFLAQVLDDPEARPCGNCDVCCDLKHPYPDRELILDALKFLRHDKHIIKSPAFFPPGFGGSERRRKIPSEELHAPGIALSSYNDAGWGKLVRQGKYEGGQFPDELIDPCREAINEMEPNPQWIAWVPSLRSDRVEQFALRLAQAVGLPAHPAVQKVKANLDQKRMQNSTRQLENVWDAFEVDPALVQAGCCLLVDDIVDSGWTLAAIAIKLKGAGSGPVIPLALATARPRGDA